MRFCRAIRLSSDITSVEYRRDSWWNTWAHGDEEGRDGECADWQGTSPRRARIGPERGDLLNDLQSPAEEALRVSEQAWAALDRAPTTVRARRANLLTGLSIEDPDRVLRKIGNGDAFVVRANDQPRIRIREVAKRSALHSTGLGVDELNVIGAHRAASGCRRPIRRSGRWRGRGGKSGPEESGELLDVEELCLQATVKARQRGSSWAYRRGSTRFRSMVHFDVRPAARSPRRAPPLEVDGLCPFC